MLRFLSRAWGPPLAGAALGLSVAVAAMVSPQSASAKATYESPYTYERTWNAALRLVRVDLGFKVLEKDQDTGYLVFEYRSPESGSKVTMGSLEMMRGQEADSPVRVIAQLPQMPQYHEQVLIDSLAAKMRSEYGDPPPKKKKPTPQPDAGSPDAPGQPPPPPQPAPPQ